MGTQGVEVMGPPALVRPAGHLKQAHLPLKRFDVEFLFVWQRVCRIREVAREPNKVPLSNSLFHLEEQSTAQAAVVLGDKGEQVGARDG